MNTLPRAPLLILLAACAAPPGEEERVAADREDVRVALHRQLDEVLARRHAIAGDDSVAAAQEREELDRLADEIAVRIVRLDPEADIDALVGRLEESR
jgi:hypothetical protein